MSPPNPIITDAPPGYPGPATAATYGTIEVHHHHHHTIRTRAAHNSCTRAAVVFCILLLTTLAFSAVCFMAWNFYNLSECEKNRMPWEKPCKDWLGKDGGKYWWDDRRDLL